MAVNTKLRLYTHRSIAKALRDGLAPTPVQEPGIRDTSTDALEEWASLFPLKIIRFSARRGVWAGRMLVQVSCFSRFASDRADKKSDAPFALAEIVRTILDQQDICVKAYGDGDAVLSAIAFGDGDEEYLDERKLGLGRTGDIQGPSNIHAVALTYTGILGSS